MSGALAQLTPLATVTSGRLTVIVLALALALAPLVVLAAAAALLKLIPTSTARASTGAVTTAIIVSLVATVISLPLGFVSGLFLIGDGHGWPHETQIFEGLTFGIPLLTLLGSVCLVWVAARRPRTVARPRRTPHP